MLVDELMVRDQMTVAEMVQLVGACGFELGGRQSKIISDALRWEVARGRVLRVARGVYRYVTAPRSTARRIRILAARCRLWGAAVLRGDRPPAMPVNRRPHPHREWYWPDEPPWSDTRWLWAV